MGYYSWVRGRNKRKRLPIHIRTNSANVYNLIFRLRKGSGVLLRSKFHCNEIKTELKTELLNIFKKQEQFRRLMNQLTLAFAPLVELLVSIALSYKFVENRANYFHNRFKQVVELKREEFQKAKPFTGPEFMGLLNTKTGEDLLAFEVEMVEVIKKVKEIEASFDQLKDEFDNEKEWLNCDADGYIQHLLELIVNVTEGAQADSEE
ncbi:unnamed protein product [Orchesella dallaii]|uniref:Uncharacterized protein n=1 Tax=Orchesella dallaii TaxID=48710 RepID=A0ABP1QLJ5_9HEXA